MERFEAYLRRIPDPHQRAQMAAVREWVEGRFPKLSPRLAWNQPVFTNHGTFIIGFARTPEYLAVVPEAPGVARFRREIAEAGCAASGQEVRLGWDAPVPYGLLEQLIAFNVADKAACRTFWRVVQ